MKGIFVYVLLITVLVYFILGIHDVLKNYEANKCEMTYMFELPEYIKITLKKNIKDIFPSYNLYLYGEGEHSNRLRRNLKSLKGIPVLFIPGNAGSYRQVRSLGSVALRMAESIPSKNHFDFFSLDLNEELSGLFGQYLEKHKDFARVCIKHILEMYAKDEKKDVNSIVLVGHSMGGVIARSLLLEPVVNQSFVIRIIITQATPHRYPIVTLDADLNKFYSNLIDDPDNKGGVTIVSTGGGLRDILVRQGTTFLDGIFSHENSISTSTNSIPRAWVSTDHLCHVWCKEVVMATVRSLFDMIDMQTSQIFSDYMARMKSVRYHFSDNLGQRFLLPHPKDIINIQKTSSSWSSSVDQDIPWKFSSNHVSSFTYHTFNLSKCKSYKYLMAISSVETIDWIGACNIDQGWNQCHNLTSFVKKGFLLSSHSGVYLKAAHLNMQELKDFSHIVLPIVKSKLQIQASLDAYNVMDRRIEIELAPIYLSLWYWLTCNTNYHRVVFESTNHKPTFHRLVLVGLENVAQAYRLSINSYNCQNLGKKSHSVARFSTPWSNEPIYTIIDNDQSAEISIKLSSGKPTSFIHKGHPMDMTYTHSTESFNNISDTSDILDPKLDLYLLSECSFKVIISPSWFELAGQFVRFYVTYIPASMAAQVILVLACQLHYISKSDSEEMFFENSLLRWAVPIKIVPNVLLLHWIISKFQSTIGIAENFSWLKQENLWFGFLPMCLYIVSFSLLFFLAKFQYFLVFCLSTFAKYLLKFSSSCNAASSSLRRFVDYIDYIILIASGLLAYFICGTISLCILLANVLLKASIAYANLKKTKEVHTKTINNNYKNNIKNQTNIKLNNNNKKMKNDKISIIDSKIKICKNKKNIDNAIINNNNNKDMIYNDNEDNDVINNDNNKVINNDNKNWSNYKNALDLYNILFSLSLIILFEAILNFVPLIIWIKSSTRGFSSGNWHDPSQFHGLLSAFTLIIFKFNSFPVNFSCHFFPIHWLGYIMSIGCILFATTQLYLISYLLDLFLITLFTISSTSSLFNLYTVNKGCKREVADRNNYDINNDNNIDRGNDNIGSILNH